MTKEDFLRLDLKERANQIWLEAEYIGTREYYGYYLSLYILEQLYVEVWIFNITNTIEKIEIVENEKSLILYLKDIDIEKLLSA